MGQVGLHVGTVVGRLCPSLMGCIRMASLYASRPVWWYRKAAYVVVFCSSSVLLYVHTETVQTIRDGEGSSTFTQLLKSQLLFLSHPPTYPRIFLLAPRGAATSKAKKPETLLHWWIYRSMTTLLWCLWSNQPRRRRCNSWVRGLTDSFRYCKIKTRCDTDAVW